MQRTARNEESAGFTTTVILMHSVVADVSDVCLSGSLGAVHSVVPFRSLDLRGGTYVSREKRERYIERERGGRERERGKRERERGRK